MHRMISVMVDSENKKIQKRTLNVLLVLITIK